MVLKQSEITTRLYGGPDTYYSKLNNDIGIPGRSRLKGIIRIRQRIIAAIERIC